MKRIVTILLFVVSLCAKGQTASVPEYVWETDWMKSYLRFIRSYHNPHGTEPKDYEEWWFDYVDDDSIPELVFYDNYHAVSYTILTTYNGKVNIWESWGHGVQWKSGTGWIFNDDASQGHEWYRYIHLQDGIFTNALSYEFIDRTDLGVRSWTTFYGDTVSRTVGNIGGDCPYYLHRKNAYDKLEEPAFVDDMPLSGLGYIKIDVLLDKAKKVKNSRIDNN